MHVACSFRPTPFQNILKRHAAQLCVSGSGTSASSLSVMIKPWISLKMSRLCRFGPETVAAAPGPKTGSRTVQVFEDLAISDIIFASRSFKGALRLRVISSETHPLLVTRRQPCRMQKTALGLSDLWKSRTASAACNVRKLWLCEGIGLQLTATRFHERSSSGYQPLRGFSSNNLLGGNSSISTSALTLPQHDRPTEHQHAGKPS